MSYTYEQSQEYTLIPDGEYECILESIEQRTTKNGKENLSLRFRIRTDIEGQEQGNRVVFETIWKEKDNPEYYNRKRLSGLIGAILHPENGEDLGEIDDIIEHLKNMPVICVIEQYEDEYYEEDRNRIKYWKTSSKMAKKLEVKKNTPVKPKANPWNTTIDIDDESIPF